jgi:hypothetical protein
MMFLRNARRRAVDWFNPSIANQSSCSSHMVSSGATRAVCQLRANNGQTSGFLTSAHIAKSGPEQLPPRSPGGATIAWHNDVMTNGDDNSTTHDDDAAHWATARGPEGSVDVRHLGLRIGELWIVGMSEDLHHDLQAGTTSPEEFNFLAREIVAAASPLQSPTPGEDDNTRFETQSVPTMLRSDRVWIERYADDWPDRHWICYPDDSVIP